MKFFLNYNLIFWWYCPDAIPISAFKEDGCWTEAWLHEYLWSIQYMWYNSVVQRTLATSHFECTQESTYLVARFFLVTCDVKWHLPVIYPLNLPKPQRLYGSFEFHSRGMQGKSYKCRSRLTREEHICRHNSALKFSSKCADFMIFVFGNIFGCMQWMPNSQVALRKLESKHHFVSFPNVDQSFGSKNFCCKLSPLG